MTPRSQVILFMIGAGVVGSILTGGVGQAASGGGDVAWLRNVDGRGLSGPDAAEVVAVDSTGDVLAGGMLDNGSSHYQDFAVFKLAGETGQVLWRSTTHGSGTDEFSPDRAYALAIDPSDDVLAAGVLFSRTHRSDFVVMKLDGETGDRQWLTRLRGTRGGGTDFAFAVAAGADGDVYAGGRVENESDGEAGLDDIVIVRLDGTTGEPIWRREIDGTDLLSTDQVSDLVLDPNGDVVAAGTIGVGFLDQDFFVVKIDHEDGAVVWQRRLHGSASERDDRAESVAVTSTGDVLAAGQIDNASVDLAVVKFAGTSGQVVWRRTIDGESGSDADRAAEVAVDSNDDVLVSGGLSNRDEFRYEFTVLKLAGGNGQVQWSRSLRYGTAEALAVDPTDRIVAVGDLDSDLAVAVFSPSGSLVDKVRVDGSDHGFDDGNDVAIGSEGQVVAAGSLDNVGFRGFDFTVLRLAD